LQRWTAEEISVLKQNYGSLPLSEIARLVGRTKNSVAAKVKSLKLNRPGQDSTTQATNAKQPTGDADKDCRLVKLVALRDRMERAIEGDVFPFMQQPAYYREYRALLADIDELERDDGNANDDDGGGQSFADTLAQLVALQRDILDRASES
jgi:hypothetical protein